MEHVFYSLAFFAFAYEAKCLRNPNDYIDFVQRVKEKELVETKDKITLFFAFISAIWSFAGMFSSQWILFLTFIVIGFVPTSKFGAKKAYYVSFQSLIMLCLIVFIILNKYHLRIDIVKLLI